MTDTYECESCGAILSPKNLSYINCRYCEFCYDAKTNTLTPLEDVRYQMIKEVMKQESISLEEAQKIVEAQLAILPRWKNK